MKVDVGWFGIGLDLAFYDGPIAFLRLGFVCLDFSNTQLAWWWTMGRWWKKNILLAPDDTSDAEDGCKSSKKG